jgi:CRP-like cAMP-binding protein
MAATDVAPLIEVPVFSLLNTEDRHTLAQLFNTLHVDRGDLIFKHGDPGDSLYIIRKGKVEIFMTDERGQRIVLAQNGPGEMFGEISLLDGGMRTASVVAIENTELLMLDRDDLLEFLTRCPAAGLGLLTAMGQRLRATNELLRMTVTRNVNLEDEEHLTLGQWASDRVTAFFGSWRFLGVILLGLGVVVLFSTTVRAALVNFAGLPVVQLALTFLVMLQATFILMTQHRRIAKDRLKADLDYKFNLKAELEMGQLVSTVERISEQLQALRPVGEREPSRPADDRGAGAAPRRLPG